MSKSTKPSLSDTYPSICRWVDILALAIAGATICLLLWSPFNKIGLIAGKGIVDTLYKLNKSGLMFREITIYIALITCSTLLLYSIILAGGLRRGHCKTFLKYPPCWLAALLATLLLIIYTYEYELLITVHAYLVLAVSAGIGVFIFGCSQNRKIQTAKEDYNLDTLPTAPETLKDFADNPDKLIEWLESDEPVDSPENDLFESHVYAQHLWERITDKKLGTIGLIGPWGSGKSSVLNIVDWMLHRSSAFKQKYMDSWPGAKAPKIYTCRLSTWGFTEEPAVRAVIKEAVNELSNHVDCLAISRLAEDYVASLDGSSVPGLGLFTRLPQTTPERQIRRINHILTAINARLVIFIEDLDRNQIKESKADDDPLNEIEALLDKISNADRISFVLAISR